MKKVFIILSIMTVLATTQGAIILSDDQRIIHGKGDAVQVENVAVISSLRESWAFNESSNYVVRLGHYEEAKPPRIGPVFIPYDKPFILEINPYTGLWSVADSPMQPAMHGKLTPAQMNDLRNAQSMMRSTIERVISESVYKGSVYK